MSEAIQHLVEALRNELQQYGETLALLDTEYESSSPSSGVHLVLNASSSIERQRAAIEAAQEQRRICQAHLAWSLGSPTYNSPADLIPLTPEDYQPLLKALLSETEELLQRVRNRARQNQNQLQKIHHLMQQFIDGIGGESPVALDAARPSNQPDTEDLPNPLSPRIAS